MFKKKIAIIGGGRWARTIASICNEFLPEGSIISMHSPRNVDGLNSWIGENGFKRIEVYQHLPNYKNPLDAVIVVNAAKNHFSAAVGSILAGIPTLVEKPLTTSYRDSEFLINLASQKGANLYCAHVLLFASYIYKYCQIVKENRPFKHINIVWTDPKNEKRYGEHKRYDSSISVIHDVFPHILSILRSLTDEEISFEECVIERGGAKVKISGKSGITPLSILLERNSIERCRLLEVETLDGNTSLDFTVEPGIIRNRNMNEVGDTGWGQYPGTLRTMLESFFKIIFDRNSFDSRFDPYLGLEASRLTEMIFQCYRKELAKWLVNSDDQNDGDNYEYAMAELL